MIYVVTQTRVVRIEADRDKDAVDLACAVFDHETFLEAMDPRVLGAPQVVNINIAVE